MKPISNPVISWYNINRTILSKVKIIGNMLKKNIPLNEALEMTDLDKQTYEKYTATEGSQNTE